MKIITAVIFLMSMMLSNLAIAQQKTIHGTVTDFQTGDPLPGVNILIKGTSNGTGTDRNGHYNLSVVPMKDTLRFSYIGYQTQVVPVNGQAIINISLKPQVYSGKEMVVVGYGTQQKKDVTGSVTSISSSSIQERPKSNVQESLAGKIAGVNVSVNSGEPGGKTRIRIRGYNSVNTGNSPLYVIDGIIGVSDIDYLNPADIKSITVLKDASATAIYGARGANGVIIIETKNGGKKGQVTYSSFVSVGSMQKKLNVLDNKQFFEMEKIAYDNLSKYDPEGLANGKYLSPKQKKSKTPNLFNSDGSPKYTTDWQDAASRIAVGQMQHLAFNGGTERTSYTLSLNYDDNEGVLKHSYAKKYSARFSLKSDIKSWLSVGGHIVLGVHKLSVKNDFVGGWPAPRTMTESYPFLPIKYPDGTYSVNSDYPSSEAAPNPVNVLKNRTNLNKRMTTMSNVYAKINIINNLEFRTSIGVNLNNFNQNFYSGRNITAVSASQHGIARISQNRGTYIQFQNRLTYEKQLTKNQHIKALLGLSWQQQYNEAHDVEAQNFTSDFYQWYNLSASSNPQAPTSSFTRWALNSYFGRVNYNLDDKYVFTITGRVDGSSKFGVNNKYAFFPSGGFAWLISNESFLEDNNMISNLKLRLTYGITGNAGIPSYRSQSILGTSSAILNGQRATGVTIGSLANPNLKWEQTAQYDAGIDLSLFNSRVSLTGDIYYKKTTDLLLNTPIPSSSGHTNLYKNIGSMRNEGIELDLKTINIQSKDFQWSTTFNFSTNRNKILHLGEQDRDIFPGPVFVTQTNVLRVGESVDSFYGFIREGTWGTNEASKAKKYHYSNPSGQLPGDVKLKDVNEDGKIDANDRVIIGNGLPKGYGMFVNTLRYKNFGLSIGLQYEYGNDILNLATSVDEDRVGQDNSWSSVLTDAWTPDHQNTMVAQLRPANSYYTLNIDSHYVENGSFIRGKNLMLSYNFPSSMINSLHLSKLRIYISVQNVFVIASADHVYDPEVNTYNGSPFSEGIVFYTYPKPRTYKFGLLVQF